MNMLAPAEPQPFKLRIEDYELLDRAGAFAGQRVELIEGVIVAVNSGMRPHTWIKNELMYRWATMLRAAGLPFDALIEPSLSLPPHNMPQPDVLIARHDARGVYYGLADAVIAIEVSASTLRTDLGIKKAMYAECRVPEYWVVDVERRQVHQFWSPAGATYADTRTVPLAGELRSATMPHLAIDGSGIL